MGKRSSPALSAELAQRIFSRNVRAAASANTLGSSSLPSGRVTFYRSDRSIVWVARDVGGEAVGAGSGVDHGGYVSFREAVVLRAYRRDGVYTAVLQAAHSILRKPIVSDVSLTAGAIGAWKRAGATLEYWEGDDRFVLGSASHFA